jgi:phenylalanyl-tRNA synthetase alpha chain
VVVKEKIEEIRQTAARILNNLNTLSQLQEFYSRFLSRKGAIASLLKELKNYPPEERPALGKELNALKKTLTQEFSQKEAQIRKEIPPKVENEEAIDITLPSYPSPLGRLHPLTQIKDEIVRIFTSLGFEVVSGPEIELDYYNFEALNMPPHHPARDTQDTFYLFQNYLLRTHTSPVQIREMEKKKPPLQIIVPGRVYRRDATDASHTVMFHQVEGLMVDRIGKVTFSHLKGVLTFFFKHLLGETTEVRFTPHYFPYTEPSTEVEVSCKICKGEGCSTCKYTGWLEVFGAGMVHPAVFKAVGYDSRRVSGFAFGGGYDRLAMLKYGIDDIRRFFENDFKFLEQF